MRAVSLSLSPPPLTAPGRPLAKGVAAALFGLALGWSVAGQAETVNVRTTRLGDLLQIPVFSAPASVVARNAPRLAAEISASDA